MKLWVASMVGMLIVTQANATDSTDVLHERVNISDLRPDTPEGLSTLYRRSHAAAERVCSPLASYDRLNIQQLKCVRGIVERATAQVPEVAHYDARRRMVRHG